MSMDPFECGIPKRILQLISDFALCSNCESVLTDGRSDDIPA